MQYLLRPEVTVLRVFVCFPPSLRVAVRTMNDISVIIVSLFGIVISFWFTIGKKFNGSKIGKI